MTAANETWTPGALVTASAVRSTRYTIHGCRPTSVTIQPASRATTAAIPVSAAARRNQRDLARSRRRTASAAAQAATTTSSVPSPTIVSQARWTTVAGGRSSGAIASKPVITVSVLNPARSEAKPGISRPPTTWSPSRIPPIVTDWSGPDRVMSSIAANFAGCCS